MKRVGVLGPTYSGKSETLRACIRLGILTADQAADADVTFLKWGKKGDSKLERGASLYWLLRHSPRWDAKELRRMEKDCEGMGQDMYVFGILPNRPAGMAKMMATYFDEVVYLHVGWGTLMERMNVERSDNAWGTSNMQRFLALLTKPVLDSIARVAHLVSNKIRIIKVDTHTPEELARLVVGRK